MVRVEVVYCPVPGPSDQADVIELTLDEGATVQDALCRSGVLQRHGLELSTVDVGLWFKACTLEQVLRESDQIQIYRPLSVDPKEARRERYRKRSAAGPDGPVSGTPRQ